METLCPRPTAASASSGGDARLRRAINRHIPKRRNTCPVCSAHGEGKVPKERHECPWETCTCKLCRLNRACQMVTKYQIAIWRRYEGLKEQSRGKKCDKCRNHGKIEVLKEKHAKECPKIGCSCPKCGFTTLRCLVMRMRTRLRRAGVNTSVETVDISNKDEEEEKEEAMEDEADAFSAGLPTVSRSTGLAGVLMAIDPVLKELDAFIHKNKFMFKNYSSSSIVDEKRPPSAPNCASVAADGSDTCVPLPPDPVAVSHRPRGDSAPKPRKSRSVRPKKTGRCNTSSCTNTIPGTSHTEVWSNGAYRSSTSQQQCSIPRHTTRVYHQDAPPEPAIRSQRIAPHFANVVGKEDSFPRQYKGVFRPQPCRVGGLTEQVRIPYRRYHTNSDVGLVWPMDSSYSRYMPYELHCGALLRTPKAPFVPQASITTDVAVPRGYSSTQSFNIPLDLTCCRLSSDKPPT